MPCMDGYCTSKHSIILDAAVMVGKQYHHFLQDGVGAQDVVLPGVRLRVLGDPGGLPYPRQTHHNYNLQRHQSGDEQPVSEPCT